MRASQTKSDGTNKVSVIIPTYNHAAFILATLDSVFKQTLPAGQVIVVNDGSPDDTRAVLAPFIETKRIRYFEQPNQGPSRARNFGLHHADGEYIAFVDDDDLWPSNKLEWQVEFLDENPEIGMVAGTLQTIDDHGVPGWKGRFTPIVSFETLFLANPFLSPGQTLIRTNLLKQLGGMNASIWGADDWDLWFRIAREADIAMLDRLALYYRLHPNNASKQVARLLNGCCETIELHLKAVAPHERRRLRIESQRNIYDGLGCRLASAARAELRKGNVLMAARFLSGLRPLWRGIAFDRNVRYAFLRNVVRG